jgi:hypothetical protein
MNDVPSQVNQDALAANGTDPLEGKLRHLFAEQRRLRDLLEKTRAELDGVNGELIRFQRAFCTDAVREEEYNQCLERILGFDPRLNLQEFEVARAGGESLEELIRELEKNLAPTREFS